MSTIEIIAVFFAILYVILAAKESIWCWLAAIISVILYTRICYSAQLYPETGLQIFYLAMAIYGYIQWNKPKKDTIIISWTKQKHLIVIIINSLISICCGYYFASHRYLERLLVWGHLYQAVNLPNDSAVE